MRYWWPVNIAEIASLQEEVLRQINPAHKGALRRGRLTTVTAIGSAGQALPFLAVPELDRAFDMDEETLWGMAYAVASTGTPDRESFRPRWEKMLQGLVPSPKVDPRNAPVAIYGLQFLAATLRRFEQHQTSGDLKRLCELLERLLEKNKAHVALISSGDVKDSEHATWRKHVENLVTDAGTTLVHLFQPAPSGEVSPAKAAPKEVVGV
jgi:hypothetical protein